MVTSDQTVRRAHQCVNSQRTQSWIALSWSRPLDTYGSSNLQGALPRYQPQTGVYRRVRSTASTCREVSAASTLLCRRTLHGVRRIKIQLKRRKDTCYDSVDAWRTTGSALVTHLDYRYRFHHPHPHHNRSSERTSARRGFVFSLPSIRLPSISH